MSLSKLADLPFSHDSHYVLLKRHIIELTGLVYYSNKDLDLSDRIQKRLSALGLSDCATYLRLLLDDKKGESELDTLVTELTIGETYFFRHQEQFNALRDRVLPELIEKNRQTKRLHIWSAGCSIGAEPYSLAILLKQAFSHQLMGWDVSILGTDINRDFLARATEGRFEEWSFRNTEESLRQNYFTQSGKSWVIEPELKKWVTFQYHNLLKHPFPSLINSLAALDLIVCRNVMIYFDQEIFKKIILHFEQSLVNKGWLVLGHAEQTAESLAGLKLVQCEGCTFFQKDGQLPEQTAFSTFPQLPLPAESEPVVPPQFSGETVEFGIEAIRELADRGDFSKAMALCERYTQSYKLNPTGFFYYALVLEQTGLHEKAMQALRRVICLDKDFVLAHYYLGLLCQRQKEPEEARRCFRNASDILESMQDEAVFEDGDGISVQELKNLIQTNLEIL